jgi:hypothetical protein
MMDIKWCCKEFEAHASDVPSKDGFRVLLAWHVMGQNRFFISRLEFRLPDKQPPDPPHGGVKIQFCPWCGCNLLEHYARGYTTIGK